jgi:hypothetical protein
MESVLTVAYLLISSFCFLAIYIESIILVHDGLPS